MKLKRPAEGWPWERRGYQFYTDKMRAWLHGYEPTMAAEMCRKRYGNSATSSTTRNAALLAGESWANGTIPGLGPQNDPGKAMRMLKNSKLG